MAKTDINDEAVSAWEELTRLFWAENLARAAHILPEGYPPAEPQRDWARRRRAPPAREQPAAAGFSWAKVADVTGVEAPGMGSPEYDDA
eukprot:12262997-Alexandrium_andersonii.AAC.1